MEAAIDETCKLGACANLRRGSDSSQTNHSQDDLQKKENSSCHADREGSEAPKLNFSAEKSLTGKDSSQKLSPLSLRNFKIKVKSFKCSICNAQFAEGISCIAHVNSHKKSERDDKTRRKEESQDTSLYHSEDALRSKVSDQCDGQEMPTPSSGMTTSVSVHSGNRTHQDSQDLEYLSHPFQKGSNKKTELPADEERAQMLGNTVFNDNSILYLSDLLFPPRSKPVKSTVASTQNLHEAKTTQIPSKTKHVTRKVASHHHGAGKSDVDDHVRSKQSSHNNQSTSLRSANSQGSKSTQGVTSTTNVTSPQNIDSANKASMSPVDVRFLVGLKGSCNHLELEPSQPSESSKNVLSRTIIVLDDKLNDKYEALTRAARRPKRKIIKLPREKKDSEDKLENPDEIVKTTQTHREAKPSVSENPENSVHETDYESERGEAPIECDRGEALIESERAEVGLQSGGKESIVSSAEASIDSEETVSAAESDVAEAGMESDADDAPAPLHNSVASDKLQPIEEHPIEEQRASGDDVIANNKDTSAGPKYVCCHCRTQFVSFGTCRLHMRTVHGTVAIEPKASIESLAQKLPTVYTYKEKEAVTAKATSTSHFLCSFCLEQFNTLETCNTHMASIHMNVRKSERLAKRERKRYMDALSDSGDSEEMEVPRQKRVRRVNHQKHQKAPGGLEGQDSESAKKSEVPKQKELRRVNLQKPQKTSGRLEGQESESAKKSEDLSSVVNKVALREKSAEGILNICNEVFQELQNSETITLPKAVTVPKTSATMKEQQPEASEGNLRESGSRAPATLSLPQIVPANGARRRIIMCSRCLKEFFDQEECNKHMRSVHDVQLRDKPSRSSEFGLTDGEKFRRIKCSICDKNFFNKDECTEHFKTVHNYKVIYRYASDAPAPSQDSTKTPKHVQQQQLLEKLKRLDYRQDHLYHKRDKEWLKLEEQLKKEELERLKLCEDRQDHVYYKRDSQDFQSGTELKTRNPECGLGTTKCGKCKKYSKGLDKETLEEIISRAMKKKEWLRQKENGKEIGKTVSGLNYYECFLCGDAYGSWKHYNQHMQSHKELVCPLCHSPSETMAGLQLHFGKHKCGPLKCGRCVATFYSTKSLVSHVLGHDMVYKCETCGKCLRSAEALDTHKVLRHSGRRQLRCEYCDFHSCIKVHLKNHIASVHAEKLNHICHVCGERYERAISLRMHLPTHDKKTVACRQCGCRFKDASQLAIHRRRIHSAATMSIQRKRALQTWQKCHQKGEGLNFDFRLGVYVCTVCGEALDTKPRYEAHMREHRQEKLRIKCNRCNITFATPELLRDHEREHKKLELMNGCDACGQVYPTAEDLQQHTCSRMTPPAAPELPLSQPLPVMLTSPPHRGERPPRARANVRPQLYAETSGPGEGQGPGSSWVSVRSPRHRKERVSTQKPKVVANARSAFNIQPFRIQKRASRASRHAPVLKSPSGKGKSTLPRRSPKQVHQPQSEWERQGQQGSDGQDPWNRGNMRMTADELDKLLKGDYFRETNMATSAIASDLSESTQSESESGSSESSTCESESESSTSESESDS